MENDIAIYDPNKNPGYVVNDYCRYYDLLIRCTENTPSPAGTFNEQYWVVLGHIIEGEGFVTMNEGNISFDNNEYLNKKGDIATGNLSFNINGMTSSTRTPIRYMSGNLSGDMTIVQGSGGTTVVGSGDSVMSDSNLQNVYKINPATNNLYLISKNAVSIITNGNGTNNYKEALKISTTGEISVLSKTSSAQNIGTLLATEAQVYKIDQTKLDKTGGVVTGQIKGITPVENNDLTRKDYVDTKISQNISQLSTEFDEKIKEYLPLSGGTMKGQIKGITPQNASDLTRKDYVDNSIKQMINNIYPVGSIYIGTQSTCPLQALGFGAWMIVGRDMALWGSGGGHSAGTTIEAGLPNITGWLSPNSNVGYDGCFYRDGYNSSNGYGGNVLAHQKLVFDASRSNAIYGRSNTVQPPAYVVNVWRRIR